MQVQSRIPRRSLEGGHHAFGGVVRGSHGHRGDGGIDHIDSLIDGALDIHPRQSGGGVGVEMNGNLDGIFDFADQSRGHLRGQQAGHVLDAHDVRSHVGQILGHLDIQFDVVHRADGVTDAAFHRAAAFLGGFDRHFNIAQIVERVKDAENIDPHFGRLFDEALDDIVGVMAVTHAVLSPEQHLERGFGHFLFELPSPLPRVFVQKPDTGVERGAAPHLQ